VLAFVGDALGLAIEQPPTAIVTATQIANAGIRILLSA
jgi:hypothetical protein